MPVVTLYIKRLEKLVGAKSGKIVDALPFLGLDIEEQTPEYIRVEYSPNRPDYATDVGVAAGLQGLLGVKTGMAKFGVKKSRAYQLRVDPATKKIRPYISGMIAKGGTLDDESIRQLIALQEDLHFGVGRRRKKASIGIHDLDAVSFPLFYTTKSRDHKFVPLATNDEMSVQQILDQMDVGRDYGRVLGGGSKVPIILDASGNTVSFPPIINSSLTTVSTSTTNLLVEVTGNDQSAVNDSLAVVASTLHNLGFAMCDIVINSKSTSSAFATRLMTLDSDLVNQILGLHMTPQNICASLKKCRLDAKARGKKIVCTIPRFRFDILGPMDLVEEVALGYGIKNLGPTLPASATVGQKNPTTLRLDSISQVMVGLGFTEALNSGLTSKQTLYDNTKRDHADMIEVAESKSQEHTILRDMILPGLLENLSRNVHESYPQKMFETGTVFSKGAPIKESVSLACVSAHKDAGYTEIKSILQSLLKTDSNIECKTKTATNPIFAAGKMADIIINDKKVGVVGEIDPAVAENFKMRVPISGFEIVLSDFAL